MDEDENGKNDSLDCEISSFTVSDKTTFSQDKCSFHLKTKSLFSLGNTQSYRAKTSLRV